MPRSRFVLCFEEFMSKLLPRSGKPMLMTAHLFFNFTSESKFEKKTLILRWRLL